MRTANAAAVHHRHRWTSPPRWSAVQTRSSGARGARPPWPAPAPPTSTTPCAALPASEPGAAHRRPMAPACLPRAPFQSVQVERRWGRTRRAAAVRRWVEPGCCARGCTMPLGRRLSRCAGDGRAAAPRPRGRRRGVWGGSAGSRPAGAGLACLPHHLGAALAAPFCVAARREGLSHSPRGLEAARRGCEAGRFAHDESVAGVTSFFCC